MCEDSSLGLKTLIRALSLNSTKGLVAQMNVETCEVATKMAQLWNKPFVTWSCSQVRVLTSFLI